MAEIKISLPGSKTIKIKANAYQARARKLALELRRAFWVGGAVREMLADPRGFGAKEIDIDIATPLAAKEIKNRLRHSGLQFFNAGEKFGTVGIAMDDGKKIEITSFRTEKKYLDSRHPSEVKFGASLFEDASRRDFTVNALYFDPKTGNILDPLGTGLKDMRLKRLRFIGSAEEKISEDALRMLRAVRFSSSLGFKLGSKEVAAIKRNAAAIKKISGTRIKGELDKIFSGKDFLKGLDLLDKTGLLKEIFPELERLKGVRQSRDFHAEGNVFVHTKMVFSEAGKRGNLLMRYAALFHDLGKWGTGAKTIKYGRPHISFKGHAAKSALILREVFKRLPFSRAEQKSLQYLISRHMDLEPILRLSEDRILDLSEHPLFLNLIDLRIADTLGAKQTGPAVQTARKEIAKLRSLRAQAVAWRKMDLSGTFKKIATGKDIMKILKLKPGTAVGNVLSEVRKAFKLGKIKNKRQAIVFIKNNF